MSFTIKHANDPDFTEELWQRLFELRSTIRDRYQQQMVATSCASLKEEILSQVQSAEKNYYFVVLEKGSPMGWVSMRIDRDELSRPIGNMFSDHLYDSVPAGFSATIAAELLRIINEIDCRRIVCEGIHARAEMVAASLGGRKTGRMDRYRLYREKANTDIINGWLESFPKKYPFCRSIFFKEVPDEHAQAYVKLMNQFIEDIPSGNDGPPPQLSVTTIRSREAARRKRHMNFYTVAILDQKGRMVGHSSASIFERNPVSGYQSLTGVERTYRGRGLSKWLKAELFTQVGRRHPNNEYFNVDMLAVNEPILRVNRAMGYELFYRGHEYMIEPEGLQRAVQSL
ncbi:MAG: hypothetical protein JSV52_06970 [Candidatus Zixiibacteriota bacterium]|nr:MAG: hypothetical protein JSV52_06970 [candidate division Zixibacteria bacterium]